MNYGRCIEIFPFLLYLCLNYSTMAEGLSKKSLMLGNLSRIILYGSLMVLLNQLMVLDAGQQGQEIKFLESTYTEWSQQLILLLMTAIFAHCAYHFQKFRCLSIMLAGISAAGLVREYNNFFNEQVFDGAWQSLALLVVILTTVLIWRNREQFWEDIQNFQGTASFGFLLSGFLTTFIFSRLFGRTTFWELVMEEQYSRSVKNAAEESIELLGYGLLLVAAVEFYILARSMNSKVSNLADQVTKG